jgi:hypothetical protein
MQGRRLEGRCRLGGNKIRFVSELDAKISIGAMSNRILAARRPIRAYLCKYGKHWHVTSKPLIVKKGNQ